MHRAAAGVTQSIRLAALIATLSLALAVPRAAHAQTVEIVQSTQDMAQQLTPLPLAAFAAAAPAAGETVEFRIEPDQTRQTLLGLGSSLEATTCWNLSRLTPAARREVLVKLLDRRQGIGMNLMRVCMGTSDFTGDPWYSYHDLPAGETDPQLERFSIDKDRAYILPVLKEALAVAPGLKFFASPWSPPGWMKSTGTMIGGRLLPEHYAAYARYFVRFVQAYQAEGIELYAVTVQNEPGVDRDKDGPKWHYPSCRWTGAEERDFIRDHLGPAFELAGLKTRIWCYDHNFNTKATRDGDDPGIDYPRTVLSDAAAARYVAGTAFHGYAGRPDGMSQLLAEFPDKPVHFTEGSQFGAGGAVRVIDFLRHGASSYNAWVTMIDTRDQPNNGPFKNNVTCVMLEPDSLKVQYRFDYFMYGQFMKFIVPGARRVECSAGPLGVQAAAVRNPDGQLVVVAANATRGEKRMRLRIGDRALDHTLPGRSVATLRWTPEGG